MSPEAPAADPRDLLRSRSYVGLLVLGAVVGVPVASVAYGFLALVSASQTYVFDDLPQQLGFASPPVWWPLLPLATSGLLVGLALTRLRGTGGHRPAEGFHTGAATDPADLPGIVLASLATLCLGAVLGPEAPLIAIGSGLGVLAVRLVRRDAPQQAAAVIGAAGSFAAVSTLLGSPITGAFLLMEAAGLAGPMMGVVFVPGLLAAGVGALIFVGLDQWTGLGTFSLAVPDLPAAGVPTGVEFLWALVIGVAAAVISAVIRRAALALQPIVERKAVVLTVVLGLLVGATAVLFEVVTGQASSYVLFSGQDALPDLVQDAPTWPAGVVVALILCKGVAYTLSLSGFRGGPVFPAIFIGAALGIALSQLPGLSLVAGMGMGMGAMSVAMLGLPLVSVLLPSLMLMADAVAVMPLVIVAVVVSYVVSARLAPAPTRSTVAAPAAS